jgi:antitoxin ChpS
LKLKIKKWGNSAAVRLPAMLLTQIGATIGDSIEIDPKTIKVAKPKYKLSELMAQCNKEAAPPANMVSWNNTTQVGVEIL